MSTRRPRIRAVATLPVRRKIQTVEETTSANAEIVASDAINTPSQSDISKFNNAASPVVSTNVEHNKVNVKDTSQRRRTIKPPVNIALKTTKNKIQERSSPISTEDSQQIIDIKPIINDIIDTNNKDVTGHKLPSEICSKESSNLSNSPGTNAEIKCKHLDSNKEESINLKRNTPHEIDLGIIANCGELSKTKSRLTSPSNNVLSQRSPITISPIKFSSVDVKDFPQRRIVKPSISTLIATYKNKTDDKPTNRSISFSKESPSYSKDRIVSPGGRKSLNYVVNSVISPRSQSSSESPNRVATKTLTNENTRDDSLAHIPPLNEECNFDPIIPLPSANKTNRPKLKPTPRFALRRNSLQGSASEAEEIDAPPSPPQTSSSASSTAPVFSTSACVSTPSNVGRVRHTSTSLPPQQQKSRTTHRQKISSNAPQQARTMKDLIFYNPRNNPIQPKDDLKKEIHPVQPPVTAEVNDPSVAEMDENDAMPVPQVKLGPNGEIVIDEQSLVIETSEAVRSRQRLQQLSVVWDGGMDGGGGRYMRGKRCKEWTHKETLRFYRALHTMGTDFSLMLSLFPGRTRRDLKVKFKKEERQNGHLVDKVLMNPLQFNMDQLERDTIQEMEEEEKEKQKVKETTTKEAPTGKKRKSKSSLSLAAQSIGEECLEDLEAPKVSKTVRITNKKLQSDYLANPLLPSPARSLLPKHLEQGSLVLLQEKDGLKAYLAKGETLTPLPLSQDEIQSITSKLEQNITYQTP